MNGKDAIKFIEATERFRIKPGLDTVGNLLNRMGNPQESLKVIHVAGTNGKGSTSAFMESILRNAGHKVGLFTSPSLESFNERIRVNNEYISDEALGEIVGRIKGIIEEIEASGEESPTEFEIVTAVAFEHFKRENVDIVVLEVGMGGRLDSTNIIKKPLVSVLVPIAIDHTKYLGTTLTEVASEKAGIIKEDTFVVVHPQEPEAMSVIRRIAEEKNSALLEADFSKLKIKTSDINGSEIEFDGEQYAIGMIGEYQPRNASVALTVMKLLQEHYGMSISKEAIIEGLRTCSWQGRFEKMMDEPLVFIDGAHNMHGILGLKKTLANIKGDRKIIGVVGIFADKDVDGMLDEILPSLDAVIATEAENPRSMNSGELTAIIEGKGYAPIDGIDVENSIDVALKMADEDSLVIIFGSLFMIGKVRSAILRRL